MAIKVKPIDKIISNWQAGAQQGAADYAANAVAAAGTYAANAGAAQASWKSGVNMGGADARYGANVRGKGQAKYARKIQSVGAARFSEGVSAGGQDMREGFQPYLDVIAGLSLPARGPRGAAGNKARSNAVQDALHNRRIGQSGAGR